MKTVKIGNHTAEVYETIEELPIVRYHKYQKYLLVDAGVGSTIEDVDRHIEKARRFCMLKDTDNAQKELENLRQCAYLIQTGIMPKHYAFAALVAKLDGRECSDLSDDALKNVLDTLNDAPNGDVTAQLSAVKKKIDTELTLYFPRVYDNGNAKEFYEKLRRRTLLILGNIISGKDTPETNNEIDAITTELITYAQPQTFMGSDSVEIQYDRQFENLCLTLSAQLNVNPKAYTVLEFYNAFEFLKEKAKAEEKAKKAAISRR